MRKFYKIILIFVLLLSTCTVFIGCENKNSNRISNSETTENNDSYLNPQGLEFYLLDNDTYGVKIGCATELSCITIPEKYCNKPVSIIMENGFTPEQKLQKIDPIIRYYKPNKLTKLVVSSNIEKIDKCAFYACNLASVEFSKNSKLEYIDDYAFAGCRQLKNITLPDSLTYIGKNAFSDTAITYIKIPKKVDIIGEYAFSSDSKLRLCSDILCETPGKAMDWDENWDVIYYNVYDLDNKMKGAPYYYRSDEAIAVESNYEGHFWKYENEDKDIYAIWGISDNNTWIIKNRFRIKNGGKYFL